MDRTTLQLWVMRGAWLLVAVLAGGAFRSTLDSVPAPESVIIEAALWLGWFAGAVALLVPHPISLTVLRVLAPAVAGVGLLGGLFDRWSREIAVVIGVGLVATAVSLLPAIGDVMVNGSAYGSERRMALRPPAVALVGPVPLAWLLIFVGLTSWALLLAGGHVLLAVVAAAIGVAAVWAAGRLLHQLARRWIVFVPAGFVVHDPFQLAEPVLLPRARIARLGPAEVIEDGDSSGDQTLDLSAGSMGLALEVETGEPLSFGVRRNRTIEVTEGRKVVFSPTLPGALLSEARIRGIRIKGSSGSD